jgi:monoamine oxidase
MGRTALFGALRRALRTAHAVNKTGLTPEELAKRAVSRRTVLRGMGAAAVVPLLPGFSAGCGDNIEIPPIKIAIVGGGMAGLHCAYRLKEVGVTAQIYEASDRVGGRMFTARNLANVAGGQLVELGGELVDTDHTTMMGLAAELGLALDDLPADTAGLRADTFHFGGNVVSDTTIVNQFTPLAAMMDAAVTAAEADDGEFERVDAMSIPEWLELEGGSPPTQLIHRILVEAYKGEYGLESDEQSIFNLLYLIDYSEPDPFRIFGDSDEAFHTHVGNDAITDALAAGLDPADVLLGHRLTKVERRADQYALTFDASGASVEVVADHVVLSLPFSALRNVDLANAGLTDEKRDIIDNLGYGTNAKLMLQFSSRTWRTEQMASGGAVTDIGELSATWETSRGQAGTQGILTNFVGGDRGISIGEGTAEERAAEVVPWIDEVFPGAGAAYLAGSAVRKHWPSEPNHLGSYACYTVGQWAYFGLEGVRNRNIHFCGEHCSQDYQGYMEGAAETGAFVALEIMADLGVSPSARLAQLVAPKLMVPQASFNGPSVRPLRRNARRRLRRAGTAGAAGAAGAVRARAGAGTR